MGLARPDHDSSARTLRAQLKGPELAKAIQTTGSLSNASTNTEREANPVEKMFELDSFAKLASNQLAKQDQVKSDLKKAAQQGEKIKAYAQEQYKVAGKYASELLGRVSAKIMGEELPLKYATKNGAQGDLSSLPKEELESRLNNFFENPDGKPQILAQLWTANLEAKRKEYKDDPDKLNSLEDKNSQLTTVFDALNALEGNGSHEEMFNVIDGIGKQDMTQGLKKLVKNYMNSLVEIGRAQQHHLGITLQNENSFLSVLGVDPRVDKHEYKRLYARMGGVLADRNGGITGAGKLYNFMEADIVHAGDPFEYKLGQGTDLDVRRLVDRLLQPAQNRTYVGVALSEDHPSPRYVYVDSDIPIHGDLPFDNDKIS